MFWNGWKSPAVESGLMELCSYWGEHREVCGTAWRRLPGSLERDVGFVWGLDPPDGLRCCIPGVDIPVPASLEQSCPTVLPLGSWGCSRLSGDEGSPQDLQGLWAGAVPLLSFTAWLWLSFCWDLAGVLLLLGEMVLQFWDVHRVSKPASGKRDNCHE